MNKIINPYLEILDNFYKKNLFYEKEPVNLYDPIKYTLSNKGKSIRYCFVIMAEELFLGGLKNSFYGAVAMEWFHNFTLIHDDIMDNASIRRGLPSVCKKWDNNVAILSGDVLMIKCYETLVNNYEGDILKGVIKCLNETAIKVCEGQQMDMDFQNRSNVTIDDYMNMAKYKTAYLLANSLKMGALISETKQENIDSIFNFGINLGLAFQMQDDFLDLFSSEKTLGKRIGGDILEGKKTFLYLKALDIATKSQKEEIIENYKRKNIGKIISIFKEINIKNEINTDIKKIFNSSLNFLEKIDTEFKNKKQNLKTLAIELMGRKF